MLNNLFKCDVFIFLPIDSEPDVPARESKFRGYFKIARHYLWGLKQIFRTFNHTAVIIVEGICIILCLFK